ncbi:fructose-bisphosphate aldolase [Williamsoniiplasma luminosum]|uniref:Fructose-1,6-bisphosphate aldolase, class II n=1 Tax=Williamsoniiplasma luminosum TaxID=214888 RepID=A0A2K8NT03_9MOLU|nr:class II fructose-1,6-bisphosphate aldolase [Williamsoniiplasma luminosum]ATZ16962.1 fructose-bisphosphate aldolase [Williamsoniiplasma luminosum]AVP49631.1 MAG: fructose-1,6-bisphosphate aldolase, class II [Williamsoniiplasma luminosum]
MSKIYNKRLVNAHNMIEAAHQNKFAIGHFNINNLEWTKAILEAAQETNTPTIIATSEGAIKYMGGVDVVVGMVNGLLEDLNITIPVALHLDHGQTVEMCKKVIDAGYSSVMFDGSHLPYAENVAKTKEVVAYAKQYEVSVEAEIGSIGGEEDGVVGQGELGDPKEAAEVSKLGISMLAAGIGNIHGKYPEWWKSLSFETLEALQKAAPFPMVLHGGSGIPQDQVKKAISMGISKINVNTELQLAFRDATRLYFEAKKDLNDETKGFDPRKLLAPGYKALKTTFVELTTWFGCLGKADSVKK